MTPSIGTERGRLIALRAAAAFDGTGDALIPDPLVLIDGGIIVAVDSGVPAPGHADVTDLGGATLLPGLVDSHTHLAFDASSDPVGELAKRSDDEALAAMTRAAQTALRGGVTTVRDLGDRDYLSLGLRGQPGLPTIATAGPPITTPRGHCHYLGGVTEPTVGAIRAAVREHAERGVDVIKIMASGGNLTPGTRQDLPQFPPEVLRAAVEEAHRLGLEVTAHAHAVGAIADAVAAGADMLEHVSFWTADGADAPADLVQLIANRRTVVGLTVGVIPTQGLTPFSEARARMPAILANWSRLHQAGALMVGSSDAGIAPVKPHDVIRYTPATLRDIGFGPAEALRAVTSTPAAILGLGNRKGRIAPGYDADLLAIDGDPLADPAALHHIRAVYTHGTAVPDPGPAVPLELQSLHVGVWAATAAAGVSAVIVASQPAFLALRFAGAAYLICLGARLLFAPKEKLPPATPAESPAAVPASGTCAFRQGFLCEITNPKTLLAFTSVMPQFIPAGSSPWQPALLGVTFAVLGFASLTLYSLALARAGGVLRRPRLARRLMRTSGGVLIGFGAALAADR